MAHTPIDTYISTYPETTQRLLEEIRKTIIGVAPEAQQVIGYGIPTFKLNGKNLVHFGAYDKHIGFYPSPAVITAFQKELSPYKQAKGSVQFPLSKPIPFKLIQKMVKQRMNTLQSEK